MHPFCMTRHLLCGRPSAWESFEDCPHRSIALRHRGTTRTCMENPPWGLSPIVFCDPIWSIQACKTPHPSLLNVIGSMSLTLMWMIHEFDTDMKGLHHWIEIKKMMPYKTVKPEGHDQGFRRIWYMDENRSRGHHCSRPQKPLYRPVALRFAVIAVHRGMKFFRLQKRNLKITYFQNNGG